GSAGVTLSDSVEVTADLADNYQYRDLWQEVGRQLQTGKQLSEPLARSPLVPPSIAQMIKSGEKSGKLSHVLEQLAGFSEEELKEKVTEMTRYIEPAMIIAMGVLIGSVALALLLPVFTISKVMAS
ncbi:MAG TPA: type II secretion system F family protein, partial [Tepidisphaeraceae bacterium]|nr:type II secretion system F family protein [Tepidisphaeraceae bacterium]